MKLGSPKLGLLDALRNHQTVTGRNIEPCVTTRENHFRYQLSLLSLRVLHEVEKLQIPEKDLGDALARLRKAATDPQHYGDNRPGLFFSNGTPTTLDARFSFLDFFGFGTSCEGGFPEFARLVGLPAQIGDQITYLLIALLLIDSSVELLEKGDFVLASADAMEAADIFSGALRSGAGSRLVTSRTSCASTRHCLQRHRD